MFLTILGRTIGCAIGWLLGSFIWHFIEKKVEK